MKIVVQENVELAPLTTFRIGGRARYFVEVADVNTLREALVWARTQKQKFFILAGGSNVLFSDRGFDGLVIKMAIDTIVIDDTRVVAGAGAVLLDVIRAAATRGLGGWEKMAGIPGTIGGAVRGNAGAFGTEVKDILMKVTALNTENGVMRTFTKDECVFGYRQSFFKAHAEWVIVEAVFALTRTEPSVVHAACTATIAEREKRHLQNVRAAGSFFMNPQAPEHVQKQFEHDKGVHSRDGRVPAGWLIEEVGLRGKEIGGAQSSLQHPNYIINKTGHATAEEVIMLASMIKMRVRDHMHVQLHEEVTIVDV